jgi:hypothetical protein
MRLRRSFTRNHARTKLNLQSERDWARLFKASATQAPLAVRKEARRVLAGFFRPGS